VQPLLTLSKPLWWSSLSASNWAKSSGVRILTRVAIYLLIVSGSVCPFRGAISTGHVPQVPGLFLGLIGGMHGHVTLPGSPLRVRSLMRRVVG